MTAETSNSFKSFAQFYPFYLAEHSNLICRRLHFIGSCLVLFILGYVVYSQNLAILWLAPVAGYGFAWVGHFFFEHNKPATFQHPLYSFIGDWVMFKDMLIGKIER
ncbi:Mpo1-like protein [Paraglaciecola sp.]|uniref:Mpo1-like protein n=1 Tax=Paraglaciecola sp. TaxID=1920173 RepID=UPI003EF77B6B